MIARVLALVARPAELTAARVELRQVHKALAEQLAVNTHLAKLCAAADGRTANMEKKLAEVQQFLSKEQMLNVGLASEINRLVRQNNAINLRADAAIAEATRVRADAKYVTAERCECGGDAELFWRRQAAAAEKQALQDRVNAIALADEVARLRLIADEAERLHQVIELGRAGIAVVS